MSALKLHVSFTYLRDTPVNKIAKGKQIINGLTANAAKFPALPQSVAQLTTLNNDLDKTQQAAANGDTVAIMARNSSEKNWVAGYKLVTTYVNYLANGDGNIIKMAGLDTTQGESVPTTKPDALANLNAEAPSNPAGTAIVGNDATRLSKSFVYMLVPPATQMQQQGDLIKITTPAGDVLYLQADTHHHAVMSGLESGKKLSVYGFDFNNKGAGPLTQTNDITPQ